ncbi:MAG: hypothetical protein FD146_1752 [Anaerolineaceae bacterium]|nr:MAG: hypothetical protein FD146_1752 [Anaerolineaceae bacterium]
MRPEYDFTGGTRGKHYRAMQAGYKIAIYQADGTTVVKEMPPAQGVVVLEPDVRAFFPDSEAVNTALRSLIDLMAQFPSKPYKIKTPEPRQVSERRK